MNEAEALNLLVQAAGLARLTKQEHVQLEQAAGILEKALKEQSDGKKVKAKQREGSRVRTVASGSHRPRGRTPGPRPPKTRQG